MPDTFPQVSRTNDTLVIALSRCDRDMTTMTIDVVLDFDTWRNVNGIEIIDLGFQVGSALLGKIRRSLNEKAGAFRPSYDDESDCAYIHLVEDERSPFQKTSVAVLSFDRDGWLCEMRVALPKVDDR